MYNTIKNLENLPTTKAIVIIEIDYKSNSNNF